MKVIGEHGKQLAVTTNVLLDKDEFDTYNTEKDVKNKIDCNNLIYKYKFGKKVSFGEISDPITF